MEQEQKKGLIVLGVTIGGYLLVNLLAFLFRYIFHSYLGLIISFIFSIIGLIVLIGGIIVAILQFLGKIDIDEYLKNYGNKRENSTPESLKFSQRTGNQTYRIKTPVDEKGFQHNKILNVTLIGGIIGLLADSPKNALNRSIKKANKEGWRVVQVIPAQSGNIFLYILRILILILTLFLYTPATGYYVILERMANTPPKKSEDKAPANR